MMRAAAAALACLLLGCPATGASSAPTPEGVATPAIPDAWGHGAFVQGARACASPRIRVVDALDDAEDDGCERGACTLREALAEDCAFVVFNVSGWSDTRDREARGDFVAAGEDLTVFGQTSPRGVGLRGGLQVSRGRGDDEVRNVVLSHLRLRPGDSDQSRHIVSGCNQAEEVPLGQGDAQACQGVCRASRRACFDDSDCAGPDRCTGSPGRQGCRSDRDCAGGGTCKAWRRTRTATGNGASCKTCWNWDHRKRFDPDDWSGCSDVYLRNAGIKDSLAIVGADDVFVDHVSAQWCSDEAVSVARYRGDSPMAHVTVQRSIIGACNDSDYARHRVAGNGGSPAGYPMLISGKRPLEGVSLVRNYFLHGEKRCPKIGPASILHLQNAHYDCRSFLILSPVHHPKGADGVIAENVFVEGAAVDRAGPRLHGVCSAASRRGCPHAGAPCQKGVHEPCRVTAPGAIAITPSAKQPNLEQRLYLGTNAYFRRDRSRWSVPTPRQFGDEWDWLPPNGLRPRFRSDPGGNWRNRRLEPGLPDWIPRPAPLDPWGPDRAERSPVWLALRDDVGASATALDGMPGGRDPVDAAYVADLEHGTGRIGPSSSYSDRYPELRDDQRWIDDDRDGVCDGWEEAHFGGLDATDGLADGDGDGYRDVEEWANGTDPNAACRTGAGCRVAAPASGCRFAATG